MKLSTNKTLLLLAAAGVAVILATANDSFGKTRRTVRRTNVVVVPTQGSTYHYNRQPARPQVKKFSNRFKKGNCNVRRYPIRPLHQQNQRNCRPQHNRIHTRPLTYSNGITITITLR